MLPLLLSWKSSADQLTRCSQNFGQRRNHILITNQILFFLGGAATRSRLWACSVVILLITIWGFLF